MTKRKNPTVEAQAKSIRRRVDRITNQVDFLSGKTPLQGAVTQKLNANTTRKAKVEAEKFKAFQKYLEQLEVVYGVKLTRVSVEDLAEANVPSPKKRK